MSQHQYGMSSSGLAREEKTSFKDFTSCSGAGVSAFLVVCRCVVACQVEVQLRYCLYLEIWYRLRRCRWVQVDKGWSVMVSFIVNQNRLQSSVTQTLARSV